MKIESITLNLEEWECVERKFHTSHHKKKGTDIVVIEHWHDGPEYFEFFCFIEGEEDEEFYIGEGMRDCFGFDSSFYNELEICGSYDLALVDFTEEQIEILKMIGVLELSND